MPEQIALAEQVIAQTQHLVLEQALADDSVVLLTNQLKGISADFNTINRIHLFVLNWQEFGALKHAISLLWQNSGNLMPQVSATVIAENDAQTQIQSGEKLSKADLLIATIDTKIASAVDIGGAEDLGALALMKNAQSKVSYEQLLTSQLQQAKKKNIASALIVKGSPYLLQPFEKLADAILVTFDDRIYQKDEGISYSPGYNTSIAIIFNQQKAQGKLPVTLKNE